MQVAGKKRWKKEWEGVMNLARQARQIVYACKPQYRVDLTRVVNILCQIAVVWLIIIPPSFAVKSPIVILYPCS